MESEEKKKIVPAIALPPYRRPKDQWTDQLLAEERDYGFVEPAGEDD